MQRVAQARVDVAGETIGQIDAGLLVFVCAMEGDEAAPCAKLAGKIAKLRVFKDDMGKMNRSLLNTGGSALIVSQFTLAGDTSRGNRPGFSSAAKPEIGQQLYKTFISEMATLGIPVETGAFGADMSVSLVNDGPVTLWLDTSQ